MDQILSAQFMSEPAWKWLCFLVAIMMFLIVWRGVVDYMKG